MRLPEVLRALLALIGMFGLGFLLGCIVTLTRGCWQDLRKTDWLLSEN